MCMIMFNYDKCTLCVILIIVDIYICIYALMSICLFEAYIRMDVFKMHIEVFTVYLHMYTYTDVDTVHYMSSCIRQNWQPRATQKKYVKLPRLKTSQKGSERQDMFLLLKALIKALD